MADMDETDETAKFRRMGLGFIASGLLFGALSTVGTPTGIGGALVALGVAVWYGEYATERTVGIGPGIGAIGLIGALDAPLSLELNALGIAALAVVVGIGDYLLAPTYQWVQTSGEQVNKR